MNTNPNRSTGPTTDAGKFESSRNAITHGLSASSIDRFPDSIRDAYRDFLATQYEEWQPGSENEKLYLERYAFSQWQYLRAQALESHALETLLASPKDEAAQKNHAKVARHIRTLERSADNALKQLRLLITDRMLAVEVDMKLRRHIDPDLELPLVFPSHLMTTRKSSKRDAATMALRFAYASGACQDDFPDTTNHDLAGQDEVA